MSDETRVVYKALADFSALRKEATTARTAVSALRKEEALHNKASARNDAANKKRMQERTSALKSQTVAERAATSAITKHLAKTVAITAALRDNAKALKAESYQLSSNSQFTQDATNSVADLIAAKNSANKATGAASKAHKESAKSANEETVAFEKAATSTSRLVREKLAEAAATRRSRDEHARAFRSVPGTTGVFNALSDVLGRLQHSFSRATSSSVRFRKSQADIARDSARTRAALDTVGSGASRVQKVFTKLGNWRPRFTPPFIALIPLIAGVIGAINPLVSLLGAAGGAALGFASSLGTLAGSALALPGLLSGVAAGISGVVVAMGGIGGVFKAYSALQKSTAGGGGGGSTGRTQEDRSNALADAEFNLAKAQRNVTKAQENLNKARQKALFDLIKLRLEVSRASLDEERAIANLVKAKEEYNNVMADPGSTAGNKLEAAVSVKEAEADLADVRDQNKKNVADLAEAEKKGVDQSEDVLDAQENLTEAYKSQRDAIIALRKERSGENDQASAGSTAANADLFQEALNKLSPSARSVVLALIAMKGAWEEMQRSVQEAFFSEIVDDMDELAGLIPVIGNLWSKAAGAMGRVVSKGIEMMSSGPWTKDFGTIADANVGIIQGIGDGVLFLLDAMRNVIVAAGPFTQWMVDGFSKGAENFRDLTESARNTGQLATYLDKVKDRMSQWWRIIKNIGKTLFNYGSAAEGFATWITDGFESITEGWKEASEEAKKEDSGFKDWLERIKPVLTAMKDMFSTFFGWFAKESAEQGNLDSMTTLIDKITNDLGPAVGRLLDSLAAANVDEKLVEAVTSIVDSITSVLDAGGAEGMTAFFDTVAGLFKMFADIMDMLPDWVVGPILSLIGGLAALSFVGKFTGVTSMIGGLLSLSKKENALSTIFGKMKGLDALKFVGLLGVLSLMAAGAMDRIGEIESVADTASKNVDAVNKGKKSPTDGVVDTGEAMVKSNPFGAGATAGVIDGLFGTDLQGVWNDLVDDKFKKDAEARDQLQTWWNDVTVKVIELWGTISGWWNGVVGLATDIWTNVGIWWDGVVGLAKDTWTNVSKWWNEQVVAPFKATSALIGKWWDEQVVAPFKATSALISLWWKEKVTDPFNKVSADISKWWVEKVTTPFSSVITNIETKWNDFWDQFKTFDLGAAISKAFTGFFGNGETGDAPGGSNFKGIRGPNVMGKSAARASTLMPKGTKITETLGNRAFDLKNGVARSPNSYHYDKNNPAMDVAGPTPLLHEFYRRLVKAGGWRQILWQTAGHYDHVHVANTGGKVPGQGNGDSVKSMLTPGEFVLRKSIVSRIGPDNLNRLNSGVMSYSDLLNKAMSSPTNAHKVGKGDRRDMGEVPNPLTAYLNGGGLAGEAGYSNFQPNFTIPDFDNRKTESGSSGSAGFTVEHLTINNPAPEPASDSLPRSIRKLAYAGSSKR